MAGIARAKPTPGGNKPKPEAGGVVPTVEGEKRKSYGEELEKEKLTEFVAPKAGSKPLPVAPPKPESGETYTSPSYRERLRKFRDTERLTAEDAAKSLAEKRKPPVY